MNDRLVSLKELNTELKFTRYTLSAINEATKEVLAKAAKLIDEINAADESIEGVNVAYIQAALKVGSHGAPLKRESKTARDYLWHPQFIQQLNALIAANDSNDDMASDEFNLLAAEATNMILYTEGIDGSLKGVDVLKGKYAALAEMYLDLSRSTINTSVLGIDKAHEFIRDCVLGRAVANRYIGLMLHRQSMDRKTYTMDERMRFSQAAQSMLSASLDELSLDSLSVINTSEDDIAPDQRIKTVNYAKDFPACLIDVAEMWHLLGVAQKEESILLGMQEGQDANKALLNAENSLREAWKYWSQAEEFTGSVNPIIYITMQSLADVLRRLERFEDAGKLYEEVIAKQIAFYGKENHTDVAKSLHSYGEFFESTKQYDLALEKLNKSLEIKNIIASPMKSFTEEAIKRVQDKIALTNTSHLRLMSASAPRPTFPATPANSPAITPETPSSEHKAAVPRLHV